MYVLKFLYLTMVGLFKQAWLFPYSIAFALKQRRQQLALNVLKLERLDRLRHPSKYLGK